MIEAVATTVDPLGTAHVDVLGFSPRLADTRARRRVFIGVREIYEMRALPGNAVICNPMKADIGSFME